MRAEDLQPPPRRDPRRHGTDLPSRKGSDPPTEDAPRFLGLSPPRRLTCGTLNPEGDTLAAYQLMDGNAERHRSSDSCVKLVLADSDPLARTAVREGIKARSDLRVVTEAASHDEVIAAIREHAPDIVLADTDLPPFGAIAATPHFLAQDPGVHVVLFSVHAEDQLALKALNAGASGFLPKDIDMSALARALKSVPRGEAAVSRRLAIEVIARLRTLEARIHGMRPVISPLTDRQWEVLDLLTAGHSVEQISARLNVSVDTARGHVRMVLRGLRARTATEAVRLAECLRTGAQQYAANDS